MIGEEEGVEEGEGGIVRIEGIIRTLFQVDTLPTGTAHIPLLHWIGRGTIPKLPLPLSVFPPIPKSPRRKRERIKAADSPGPEAAGKKDGRAMRVGDVCLGRDRVCLRIVWWLFGWDGVRCVFMFLSSLL